MSLEERAIFEKQIYNGKIINVALRDVLLPNGNEAKREIVYHGGACAVIALYQGKIILVKQFRSPTGEELLEIPAGKLEKEEDIQRCALRELKEETGLSAGKIRKLTSFYTTPGFSNEIIHLYLCDELKKGEQDLDEDEFIDVVMLSPEEAKEKIISGQIKDAKSILAILWYIALE